jgi:acyl transferase domain-containing protein/NADPH:quinone reductase-like Zn-dependent oxidoreductase/SAM-dependent methyltransferase/short-subunit dehydrogenase/acyl carrier protein
VSQSSLSPLKQAYLKLEELQARLQRAENQQHEPIAIVGMGCRLPGGVVDAETYWQLLRDGVDATRDLPADRWDADRYYAADPQAPGRTYSRRGGYLERVDEFEPQFFGVAPREAAVMDPQQRLLLEVAWEALEHAGIPPRSLENSRTGVFVALSTSDYWNLQVRRDDLTAIGAYHGSGIAYSVASGRISYVLGLQGPAISLDTACSGSLVAVHLACQSLRTGECRMAIAGGVNLILSPENSVIFAKSQMLAADGRCKTFDASADGFAEGEGCALIVVKRLSDALTDGDRVLAVIRGSAVNQDGPSGGLTAPNGPSQEAVIREALDSARVRPGDVSYIEAHGTGTKLGDPIEVQALSAVLAKGRDASTPIWIGSVKTNLGHLEAAAGVAGLLKVVLALQHKTIPPHLHFRTPNPYIPWAELPVAVPVEAREWTPTSGRRIAGVSAFGFSGTNAHVVLEEAPSPIAESNPTRERPLHLLALSARGDSALRSLAALYANRVTGEAGSSLANICFTANAGRSHESHRAVLVGATAAEMSGELERLAKGEPTSRIVSGVVEAGDPPKVAFLFTGQGSQYTGMGRELYETQPTFRAALDRCADALKPHLREPLCSVIFATEHQALLDRTEYTQPALFALEYALAELWQSWGVRPAAVLGHSLGEYVAACIAGACSLEDALVLVAARARRMQSLPSGGEMLAVMADEQLVADAIARTGGRASIAAVNGPGNVVVSGATASVRAVAAELAAAGIAYQPLRVSHAFHSSMMDPILDAFEDDVRALAFGAVRIPLASNLTGRLVRGESVLNPGYWRRHLREPVRFADGLAALRDTGIRIFVEIGPTPTLTGMGRRVLGDAEFAWFPSLAKDRQEWQSLLASVAGLYAKGVSIDWKGFDRDYQRSRISVPTYPFQRKRYWFDAQPGAAAKTRHSDAPTVDHPLLHRRLRSGVAIFEADLDARSFIGDHRVGDRVILPATAYVEIARAAAAMALGSQSVSVEDVTIGEALVVPEEGYRTMQVAIAPGLTGRSSFQVFSADDVDRPDGWRLHATGQISTNPPVATAFDQAARERCKELRSADDHYQSLEQRSLSLGSAFKGVARIWRAEGEAVGELTMTEEVREHASEYGVHPALLDAALQTVNGALPSDPASPVHQAAYLPIGIDRVHVHQPARSARAISHVQLRPLTGPAPETMTADVRLYDEDGTPLVEVIGLHLKRRGQDDATGIDSWFYEVQWEASELESVASADMRLDTARIAAALREQLPSVGNDPGLARYDEVVPSLETATNQWVVRALQSLGWTPQRGERISEQELGDRLGVLQRHRRLLHRLLGMVSEDGLLEASGDAWVVTGEFQASDPSAIVKDLLQRHPEYEAEITLLARCGPDLAGALRGEVDPLQILFPGGDLSTAERLYEQSPVARAYNGLIRSAVMDVFDQLGSGPVRILEIGGGTGGTTSGLLPLLPTGRTEYVFTDISRQFTVKAAAKYRDYSFVTYRTLDIEQSPSAQGFAGEQYDIVIAANVLHATRSLGETLQHVRSLLAPRGVLVALEMTRPQRDIDVVFGLTDGWWRFSDLDVRPTSLLLPAEGWLALLADCGFRQATAISTTSENGGCASNQAVLVAGGAERDARSIERPLWLLFEDESGQGRALAEQLTARGRRVARVRRGAWSQPHADEFTVDPSRPDTYERLFDAIHQDGASLEGVAHLWSLDASPADRLTVDHLEREQELGARSVLGLVQAMTARAGSAAKLCLVTRGGQASGHDSAALRLSQAPVWGLAKVIALEHPELRCRRIDLDPEGADDEIGMLANELVSLDREDQVMLRGARRLVARLSRFTPLDVPQPGEVEPVRFEIEHPGMLDSLVSRKAERRAPGAGEVEIRVAATGLNFRDVMGAMGIDPSGLGALGCECTGTVVALGAGVADLRIGDDVVAVVVGSLGSFVTAQASLVTRRPAGLGIEHAASHAIPYVTAQYALQEVAALQPGERVLIHSAAGGVGLAALYVARKAGADVIATAGSEEKRAYLRSLGVSAVFDSRSATFADAVREATGGRGVDVVLNSLGPELVQAGLSTLAKGGRFLEIAKTGILNAEERRALRSDIHYHVVDWSDAARETPALIHAMLRQMVTAVASGELPRLPVRVFTAPEVVAAFRHMAQAKHIGRVVITQQSDTHRPASIPVRAEGTYVVTGAFRGLGLLVAQHLVENGARHLLLIGRSAPSPAAADSVRQLEAQGARVVIARADVAQRAQMAAALEKAAGLPPIVGVFHSAGLLNDGVLQRLDWSRFAEVLAPKVSGAWNLYELTREHRLDCFVLFSSIAGLFGSPGQGNHAAANAFLDTLAHYLRSRGVPALSINWGAWADIGAAADRGVEGRIGSKGIDTIAPERGLEALDRALMSSATQLAVTPVRWSAFLESYPSGTAPRFFERVAPRRAPAATVRSGTASGGQLLERLAAASAAHRRTLLVGFVRDQLARVLGLPESDAIDPKQPFSEIGLDSLMAIELRNLLGSGLALERPLPATLVFECPTVQALAEYVETELPFADVLPRDGVAAVSVNQPPTVLSAIEELSDEEVDRLFARRVEGQS